MAVKRGKSEAAPMKLTVEEWPTTRLIEYARNPRKNDDQVDRMCAAIREFGFRIPIVAKSDGLVVDGHLRLKAARKLGLEVVPVALADDLTDAQIKAFRLLANKSAEWASWDMELLQLEVQDLAGDGFDLGLIGFDEAELAQFFETAPDVEPPEDFPEKDETLEIEHECPKCGYRWSGGKVTDRHGDEPE